MPQYIRRMGSGITRWADLVLGFSLDEVRRHGVGPEVVSAELASGSLSLQTFFFEMGRLSASSMPDALQFGYNSDARLVGALAARSTILAVSGGEPFGLPFSMQYQRQNSSYQAARATFVVAPLGNAHLHSLTTDVSGVHEQAGEVARYKEGVLMPEVRVAHALSNYADYVESEFDAGRMIARSIVSSPSFGEIQSGGPG